MNNELYSNSADIERVDPFGINAVRGARRAIFAAGVAASSLLAACSESTPDFNYDVASADSNDSTDTTSQGATSTERTTTTEALTDREQGLADRLEAGGMNADLALEIIQSGSGPLNNPDYCVDYVETAENGNAFRNNQLVRVDSETVINVSEFMTAGLGIKENGGPNDFTDSVGPNYHENTELSTNEVATYFSNPEMVDERTVEATEELFGRLCANPHELASGLVTVANAKVGNTDVRLGEIYQVIGDYLVSEDRTTEEMTDAVNAALDSFFIEFPEGVETTSQREDYIAGLSVEDAQERVDAYNRQLSEASKLTSVLLNFLPTISTTAVETDGSMLTWGTNENNYAELAYSEQTVGGDDPEQALGGSYTAMPGSLLTYVGKFKGGCVVFENGAFYFNLLDGRGGYVTLVSAPEGCDTHKEPETPPTPTTGVTPTTRPPEGPTTTIGDTTTTAGDSTTTAPPTTGPSTTGRKGSVPTTLAAPSTTDPSDRSTTTRRQPPSTAAPDTLPGGVTPTTIDYAPITVTVYDPNGNPTTIVTAPSTTGVTAPPATDEPGETVITGRAGDDR